VGADNFYSGLSRADQLLTRKALDILRSFPVRTPGLKEMERSDAVLVLGEDLTNTAPMMALALRQAVRQVQFDLAAPLSIPFWNDQAVREIAQEAKSPL
jgi:NADH-quinone oxidoreductase subunit G